MSWQILKFENEQSIKDRRLFSLFEEATSAHLPLSKVSHVTESGKFMRRIVRSASAQCATRGLVIARRRRSHDLIALALTSFDGRRYAIGKLIPRLSASQFARITQSSLFLEMESARCLQT